LRLCFGLRRLRITGARLQWRRRVFFVVWLIDQLGFIRVILVIVNLGL
jgi:hypothetical protein